MNEYTFNFYSNGKCLSVKTFHAEMLEDAFKIADEFLKQNPKYDDWEFPIP